MDNILTPVSPGEVLDKITILRLKLEKIAYAEKLKNVAYELRILEDTAAQHIAPSTQLTKLTDELQKVNAKLWDIEDDIRICERSGSFDDAFVDLARAVYVTNDERARPKREINVHLDSEIIEEKSYATLSKSA
ncbi:DUF6165 family protein [Nereida ignava]|uniref:DUF6165 family protein n=1 Tax=Nereida TaxID=282198 RepID=UPI0023B44510